MKWDDNLSVGVAQIDDQHKALIDAVNELLKACSEGKGRKQISATMEFLANYTVTHFHDEEALQLKYAYPDYQRHRQIHADFVKTIGEYQKQLEAEGPTISLVAKLNSFVTDWLIHHISVEDKKIGEHIRDHAKA